MSKVRILTSSEVNGCLPGIEEAVSLIERGFQLHAEGRTDQPPKPYVRPLGRDREREGGRLITMPAYLGGEFEVTGLKAVSSVWTNVESRGLPRASASVQLNDPRTGRLLAFMDGSAISALRTAATAVFAARRLANDSNQHVAVIGAGRIGRQIIDAFASDSAVESISIFDRALASADSPSSSTGRPLRVAKSARECVEGASIVVAATTSEGPYLESSWFARGSVYIAVSLVDADPLYMLEADHLVVDDWVQSCREGKPLEVMHAAGLIRREDASTFADLASGKKVRRCTSDRIYVNPMGVAIEDLAIAHATYRNAEIASIGLTIDLQE